MSHSSPSPSDAASSERLHVRRRNAAAMNKGGAPWGRSALETRAGKYLTRPRAAAASAILAVAGGGFLVAYLLVSRHGRDGGGRLTADAIPGTIKAQEEKLRSEPENISTLVSLGEMRFKSGESGYVEAINDLEEARDLGALDPKIFRMLGLMYQREGLYPFALKEYERYMRHFPNDKDIALRRAKLLYEMKRYAEASEQYAALLEEIPSDPLIKENLALSFWKNKEDSKAWRLFSELEALGGTEAGRAAFFLGEMSYAKRRYKNALTYFRVAEKISRGGNLPGPGFEPGVLQREMASAFQKLGRWKEAREYLKSYHDLNPNEKPVPRRKLKTLSRRGKG